MRMWFSFHHGLSVPLVMVWIFVSWKKLTNVVTFSTYFRRIKSFVYVWKTSKQRNIGCVYISCCEKVEWTIMLVAFIRFAPQSAPRTPRGGSRGVCYSQWLVSHHWACILRNLRPRKFICRRLCTGFLMFFIFAVRSVKQQMLFAQAFARVTALLDVLKNLFGRTHAAHRRTISARLLFFSCLRDCRARTHTQTSALIKISSLFCVSWFSVVSLKNRERK